MPSHCDHLWSIISLFDVNINTRAVYLHILNTFVTDCKTVPILQILATKLKRIPSYVITGTKLPSRVDHVYNIIFFLPGNIILSLLLILALYLNCVIFSCNVFFFFHNIKIFKICVLSKWVLCWKSDATLYFLYVLIHIYIIMSKCKLISRIQVDNTATILSLLFCWVTGHIRACRRVWHTPESNLGNHSKLRLIYGSVAPPPRLPKSLQTKANYVFTQCSKKQIVSLMTRRMCIRYLILKLWETLQTWLVVLGTRFVMVQNVALAAARLVQEWRKSSWAA